MSSSEESEKSYEEKKKRNKKTIKVPDIEDLDIEDIDSSDIDEVLEYKDKYELPLLFKLDAKDKERVWKVWAVDDEVHKLGGLVEGKKTTSCRVVKGKNIGKKNETTPEEQAKAQVERDWIKQIDKGYKPKCKEGKTMYKRVKKETDKSGGHNINAAASIRGGTKKELKTTSKDNFTVSEIQYPFIPMKAQVYEVAKDGWPLPKVEKYIKYDKGVYVQWKLDGVRCPARIQISNETGEPEVVLTSNSGKQFPWCEEIRRQVLLFLDTPERRKLALDGLDCELYAHNINDENGEEMPDKQRFSTITSICAIRRTDPHPLETQICLYVFDLVNFSGKYNQDKRFRRLKKLFKSNSHTQECPNIVLTETHIANSHEEMVEYHDKFAASGYEGVIIRDRELCYKIKGRSLMMRKHKYFIDEEYTVVDAERDEGVDSKHFSFKWICESEDGTRFSVTPKGTRDERKRFWKKRMEYLGRKLTVKYQNLSEDDVPRFGVGKGFRDEGDL